MNARILGTLCAVLVLVGCGDTPVIGTPGPQAKPPDAKPAPTASTASAGLVPYAYSPVGKRDPFRSPVEEVAADKSSDCQEPLCAWDLDQLSLVAIVTGDSSPLAMVEDPQGRGHIVHRNSRMGKQGGRVTTILRDSLTITEYWRQPDGKMTANPVQMALKKGQTATAVQDLSTGREM